VSQTLIVVIDRGSGTERHGDIRKTIVSGLVRRRPTGKPFSERHVFIVRFGFSKYAGSRVHSHRYATNGCLPLSDFSGQYRRIREDIRIGTERVGVELYRLRRFKRFVNIIRTDPDNRFRRCYYYYYYYTRRW